MKDKEERKLQFVLRYYEDGKLDTRKALKKIIGIAHQNKVSGFWAYLSGIAAAILICVVSYTLLSRKEHHTVLITADAMVTRYFLPDSTLAILSQGRLWNMTPISMERLTGKSTCREKSILVSEEMRCLLLLLPLNMLR